MQGIERVLQSGDNPSTIVQQRIARDQALFERSDSRPPPFPISTQRHRGGQHAVARAAGTTLDEPRSGSHQPTVTAQLSLRQAVLLGALPRAAGAGCVHGLLPDHQGAQEFEWRHGKLLSIECRGGDQLRACRAPCGRRSKGIRRLQQSSSELSTSFKASACSRELLQISCTERELFRVR